MSVTLFQSVSFDVLLVMGYSFARVALAFCLAYSMWLPDVSFFLHLDPKVRRLVARLDVHLT